MENLDLEIAEVWGRAVNVRARIMTKWRGGKQVMVEVLQLGSFVEKTPWVIS